MCAVVPGVCVSVRAALSVVLLLNHACAATCPTCCLCPSDIISCSGCGLLVLPRDLPDFATRLDLSHNALSVLESNWPLQSLDRLTMLLLSRNAISHLAPTAFSATPHLRHLDLSSNRLALLNASAFGGLGELEVLLLFGNQIVQVASGAFRGLGGLRKLYLGGNRLARFPLELYDGREGAPTNLTFLDLSSNVIRYVPTLGLLALPDEQQRELYLQGNPLACDCPLFALLEFWERRHYRPLLDFTKAYPCIVARQRGTEEWLRCAGGEQGTLHGAVGGVYRSQAGDRIRVQCPGITPPLREGAPVVWLTPRRGSPIMLDPSGNRAGRLTVLPDGSLEIRGTLPEDAGTYWCVAVRVPATFNDTLEVTLSIQEHGQAEGDGGPSTPENFNTAFTTLASCVISIILVMLYLYLSPCSCRTAAIRSCGGRALLLCVDPRGGRKKRATNTGKRVAFLDPDPEAEAEQKCGLKPAGGNSVTEVILKPEKGDCVVKGVLKNARGEGVMGGILKPASGKCAMKGVLKNARGEGVTEGILKTATGESVTEGVLKPEKECVIEEILKTAKGAEGVMKGVLEPVRGEGVTEGVMKEVRESLELALTDTPHVI